MDICSHLAWRCMTQSEHRVISGTVWVGWLFFLSQPCAVASSLPHGQVSLASLSRMQGVSLLGAEAARATYHQGLTGNVGSS